MKMQKEGKSKEEFLDKAKGFNVSNTPNTSKLFKTIKIAKEVKGNDSSVNVKVVELTEKGIKIAKTLKLS